jgi:hypothetical protein
MRPDERELDDEIRGHLALSVKERIERGEQMKLVIGCGAIAADRSLETSLAPAWPEPHAKRERRLVSVRQRQSE